MRVGKDTVVTIEYVARLDDGTVIDSTEHCGPVSYLHGNEQIFAPLEEAVDGLEPGGERTIRLAAGQSYGERREELVRRVPRAQMPPDLTLVVGERYTIRGANGQRVSFRLLALEGDEIVADFNARTAGSGLEISAKVLAVRAATAVELRRGTLR